MSRGFRDSDTTQAMSEQAVADAIGKILERDGARGGGDGLCVDCGEPISPERLEVLPDAARCLRCQAAWEQANRL
jgi:phage/conjugal plasmid C-4 type zinc finger TraR family protein